MSVRVFEQDATPTTGRPGDIWVVPGGATYICNQASPQVWNRVGTEIPGVEVLTDTCTRATFTDGGSTSGTRVMAGVVPAGAILLGSKVTVNTTFIGDTSAALTIGDGSDTDRYNTSTLDVFTATGLVQSGVPSGNKLITTANSPTLTVTSNADFTNVSAGSVTVSIYYIRTV